eukprot:scaffold123914_cov99-Phaeocystis_antarctica.AAC.1
MESYCVTGEGTHRDHEILECAYSPKFGSWANTPRKKSAPGQQMLLPQRGRATARAARNGRHAS